jgi:chromosome segregation ATPase
MAQLFPWVSSVDCEKHGQQATGRVPNHLVGLFEGEEQKGWACIECVKEAKELWETQRKENRRKKEEEKKAKRQAIKEAKKLALDADTVLTMSVAEFKDTSRIISNARSGVDKARRDIKSARMAADQSQSKLRDANEAHVSALTRLRLTDDALESAMDALDVAYSSISESLSSLQSHYDEAEEAWNKLGKAAKKKRDKTARRAALELLKEHRDGTR